ncbi:MAG: indole-3-glycerol-phosphate synthase [Gammaproteobacteria bacterium]|nr:indole-3-glycerol-phosphate synthase [Gammaproteobacteria bacterium]MDH3416629.1 indole-3-glycerol-phosphate synthase [Gammaproteobacteria bacterium]
MSDFLKTMAELSAERARAANPALLSATFDKPLVPLQLGSFDVIAEIKDRSPAEGELAAHAGNRAERAQQYAQGGAVAISVLTEPSRFSGSLEHLEEVVMAVPGTPVMRKDFLVAPVQILEARAAGASGVLLIVTMLDDGKLREMLDCAWQHGMFVLLESFDSNDLARVDRLLENEVDRNKADDGQLLIGINTRNLRTLEVDGNRLEKLAPELPSARCVAESGLHTAEDAARVSGLGYRLALVGTALMRSDDPAVLVAQMCAAGSGRDPA